MHTAAEKSTDTVLTDEAAEIIDRHRPDFVFLYMAETDEVGHGSGWMSEEYLRCVRIAIENAARMIERYGDEYRVIITADHGGHDRSHGSEMDEDMLIPLFLYGSEFEAAKELDSASILDVAPTVASLMGIRPEPEWEGKSLA
jgi:bisphosphoglycerate-independent phosphoglycerate mutase (AlkP superfamily)